LLDTVLFGHVKGAFTSAASDSKGLFVEANGGTLFLDEISQFSADSQAHLLRVIEDGEVTPIGGTRSIHVDVRLVAATNRDLRQDCDTGRFRKDLYERFDCPIKVPSLKDRVDDIPPFVHFFVSLHSPTPLSVDLEVIAYLQSVEWPGNVRGLDKAVRRAVRRALTRQSSRLQIMDFNDQAESDKISHDGRRVSTDEMFMAKKSVYLELLEKNGGNIRGAAKELEVSPTTIYGWLDEQKIDRNSFKKKRSY
jgi:DNA-binding NtrC family response regulator